MSPSSDLLKCTCQWPTCHDNARLGCPPFAHVTWFALPWLRSFSFLKERQLSDLVQNSGDSTQQLALLN